MTIIPIEEMSVHQVLFDLAERTTIKMIREKTKLTDDELWKAATGEANIRVHNKLKKLLRYITEQEEKDIELSVFIHQKHMENVFFPEYDDTNLTKYADKHGA